MRGSKKTSLTSLSTQHRFKISIDFRLSYAYPFMNNRPSLLKIEMYFNFNCVSIFFFTLMKIVQWAIRIEICDCKCLTNQNHLRCSNTLRGTFFSDLGDLGTFYAIQWRKLRVQQLFSFGGRQQKFTTSDLSLTNLKSLFLKASKFSKGLTTILKDLAYFLHCMRLFPVKVWLKNPWWITKSPLDTLSNGFTTDLHA